MKIAASKEDHLLVKARIRSFTDPDILNFVDGYVFAKTSIQPSGQDNLDKLSLVDLLDLLRYLLDNYYESCWESLTAQAQWESLVLEDNDSSVG